MRRMLVLTALVAGLLAPLPAHANGVPTTGTRINLFPGFVGPTTYPADTPFYVEHGFGCADQAATDVATDNCLDPQTTFVLLVNGVQQQAITDLEVSSGGIVEAKFMVSNFRNGLPAGTYLFEGQWFFDGTLVQDSVVYITFT